MTTQKGVNREYINARNLLLNPSNVLTDVVRDLIYSCGIDGQLTHRVNFHNFRDPGCVYCLQQFITYSKVSQRPHVIQEDAEAVVRYRNVPIFMSMIDMIDKAGRNGIYDGRETEVLDSLYYEIDPIDPESTTYEAFKALMKNTILVATKMLVFIKDDNNVESLRPRYVVNGNVVSFDDYINFMLNEYIRYGEDGMDPSELLTLQCGHDQGLGQPMYPVSGTIEYPMTEVLRIANCPFMVNQLTYPQIELYSNFITDDFVAFGIKNNQKGQIYDQADAAQKVTSDVCDGKSCCDGSECSKGCGKADSAQAPKTANQSVTCGQKSDRSKCGKMPVPRYMGEKKPRGRRRKTTTE